MSPVEVSRYARQMALDGWGRQNQERLKSSRALLAGAGGLGGAAAASLLAAGLGALRLVDEERVSLADLCHYPHYRERDLGKPRAAVLEAWLKEINSFSRVEGQVKALSERNVLRLASGCHLLLACREDGAAGGLLNQAAVRLRLPLVYAWVWGSQARLSTFWPGRGPCLACARLEGESLPAPSLLGPLPGFAGTLLALEAMRILGGVPPALVGRLLVFDAQRFRFTETQLKPAARCSVCQAILS